MNGGLVFAEPEEAKRIDKIQTAFCESKTWGEFRQLMPATDYHEVIELWNEQYGHDVFEAHDDEGEPTLGRQGDVEFNPEQIPWYCDGDYPKWLQQHMGDVVPAHILQRYGSIVSSVFNGEYIHIEPRYIDNIVSDLEEYGYEVIDGTSLSFC